MQVECKFRGGERAYEDFQELWLERCAWADDGGPHRPYERGQPLVGATEESEH